MEFQCGNCASRFNAEPDANGIVVCPVCNQSFMVAMPPPIVPVSVDPAAVNPVPAPIPSGIQPGMEQILQQQSPDPVLMTAAIPMPVPSSAPVAESAPAAMDPDREPELPAGTVIGGFEIIRLVGYGGTGNVYLATQLSMQRSVALKVLSKQLTSDKTTVTRFLNEIKLLGQIQHPNIVSAIDAGEAGGLYFLAMQFVLGRTMEDILRTSGPIPEYDALKHVITIATALKFVWDKYRIFHRDIKPGNIMFNEEDDDVMLLDLGIAQSRGESNIVNGQVEGSPYYMSPEQIHGDKLTWSTDLYSLGTTFYHLLVGVPPYEDANDVTNILEQHCMSPFPMPKLRNPDARISEELLVPLLRKMMEKRPEDRFASWDEFLKEAKKTLTFFETQTVVIRRQAEKAKVREQKKMLKGPGAKNTVALKTGTKKIKLPNGTTTLTQHPVRRSSTSGLFAVINLVVICAILLGIGYYVMQRNNTKSAQNAYDQALKCALSEDYDPGEALGYLIAARKLADKMGVDPVLRQKIEAAYSKTLVLAENRRSEDGMIREKLDDALRELNTLKELLKVTRNLMQDPPYDDQGNLRKCKELHAGIMKALNRLTPESEKNKIDVDHVKKLVAVQESEITAIEKNTEHRKTEEKERLAAEKKAQAEMEAQLAAERKKEEDRQVVVYHNKLNDFRKDLHRQIVVECRKGNYDKVLQIIQIPRDLSNPKPNCQAQYDQLKAWHDFTADSVEKCKEAATALKKHPDIRKVTLKRLETLLPQKAELYFPYLLLNGSFVDARKLAETEIQQQYLKEFANAYLRWRLERAAADKENGQKFALESLDKDYGKLPEYQSLRGQIIPE